MTAVGPPAAQRLATPQMEASVFAPSHRPGAEAAQPGTNGLAKVWRPKLQLRSASLLDDAEEWALSDTGQRQVEETTRGPAGTEQRQADETGDTPEVTGPVRVSRRELVARIKELQRQSREQRDEWRVYCETRGGGTRDPGRHHDNFLRQFLDGRW